VVLLTDVLASETGKELIVPSVSATTDLLGLMLQVLQILRIGTLSAPTREFVIVPLVYVSVTKVTPERDAADPHAPTTAPDTELATTLRSYPTRMESLLLITATCKPTLLGITTRSRLVSVILTMRELIVLYASVLVEITF
jgi:hypothetical protein